ncbi:unnamed protein product [Effrenium voratum]|nr:unnamed protein product [Effrenium voratum]
MAPSELVWQAEDEYGCCCTAPWPASGAGGLELRPPAPCYSCADLHELRPGAEPRRVAQVGFFERGLREVTEKLPSGRERQHDLPDGCASVRLRWERAAGRWKLWVEAGGERRVLQATFESSEPQLELRAVSAHMDRFHFSLLPPPGPGTLQSPPPAHAQLQARIDQLTAELETEKQQKAEFAQNLQKQRSWRGRRQRR